ncbi:MAG: proton-conducting membrane transporter [Lachnospiraceae bacterium]|nr:proton-conducting membrane transporter [Lachnospiraceae bacterium]
MSAYLPGIVILVPFLGGILIPLIPFKSRTARNIYTEGLILINAVLVAVLLFNPPQGVLEVIKFTGNLRFAFKVDGMATLFAGMISFLWPLATLYAFEYMTKEEHEDIFFMFYSMTYGVTLGIALAGNLLTLYCFYEMLTLVTVPLVLHTLTREAVLASRKYLYYSLGGAAFAFIGLIFIIMYGNSTNFVFGGVLDMAKIGNNTDALLLVYVMAFMGFGVKAAVCPFNSWLPDAGVAPTPVTALLHAVAVVKSGAFAIIRITYYSFGTDFLRGTWAQSVVMAVTIFTIVYGCSRAVKETHLKRRLAYSTISNLSYILFGVTIMTPAGLIGALTHMLFHAFMKIASFFCAGAVIHQTEKEYVHELNGLGRRMPVVFSVFLISALALMGVPGLAGFISKWNLAAAAVESNSVLAYAGVAALLISALLTAIYMMTIVMRAFFPGEDFNYDTVKQYKDPNWQMLLPLCIFAVMIVFFGLKSDIFVDFFGQIAKGL